jgi:hypothetical protein
MTPPALLLVPAALGTLLILGCRGMAGKSEVEPPISVDRITDQPEAFTGERVRLSARVAEPHGNRVLTLKDDDPVRKEQMLVVTRRPLAELLGEDRTGVASGDQLLVTGVVHAGDLPEIERELGLDLAPELEKRFRGKPILVASEIVRTDVKDSPATPDTLSPRN